MQYLFIGFCGHNGDVLQQTLTQTLTVSAAWIAQQDLSQWLSARELGQAAAFHLTQRRADWTAGRLAVKRLLREQWDIDPLTVEVGTDGVAPVLVGNALPPVNVSLSHCAGAGAASWEHNKRGTVGVDLQHVRAVHGGLARRILSPHEAAQLSIERDVLLFWALKEAAIKACRRPYRRGLREIVVTLLNDNAASVVLPNVPCALSAEWAWEGGGAWLARAVLPEV